MDLDTYRKKYRRENPSNRHLTLPAGGYLSIDLDNHLRWHAYDCSSEITIGQIVWESGGRKIVMEGGGKPLLN